MMTRVAVILGIGVLGVSVYAFFSRAEKPSFESYSDRFEYWSGEFAIDESAYQRLIESGNSLSYDASHEVAHMAGEILYETSGVRGIARCTAEYQFGCYHGFAGRALDREGLESLQELRRACDASLEPLGCLHGIGHGVLAFLGSDKLDEALHICASLKQESPVGGCFGGVFMEYNFNTMQSETGILVRPFNEADAHEPCMSLPEEFKTPCYFDAPAWWHAAATNGSADETERFAELGVRCSMLPREYRVACYEGVGNVIGPTSGYSEDVMRSWCNTMPTEGREPCFSFAHGHLRARDPL